MSEAGTGPVRDRNSSSRAASSAHPAHERAHEGVVVPGEVLRGRVERDVAAVLERPDVERRRRRRVADDTRRMSGRGSEVRQREKRIRRRLQPDEVDAVRRRAGLVELDLLDPPARELVEDRAGSVVGAFRERDRLARTQQREHERRRGRGPRGEEQRLASVERSDPCLGLRERRARVARVRERPGLTVLERPRGRAVDRRARHRREAIRDPG